MLKILGSFLCFCSAICFCPTASAQDVMDFPFPKHEIVSNSMMPFMKIPMNITASELSETALSEAVEGDDVVTEIGEDAFGFESEEPTGAEEGSSSGEGAGEEGTTSGEGDAFEFFEEEESGGSPEGEGEETVEDEDAETESFGVLVEKIEFEGNTVIDSETLGKITADYSGRELSLEEMGDLADLVTITYQEQGFILARAYLPEQEIGRGTLTIAVAEGIIGKIVVAGNKLYKDEVIKRYFKPQATLRVVKESFLEKGILLANELPKVKTDIVLKEGEKEGEVDVVLNVKESAGLTLGLEMGFDYNNYGLKVISEDRYGVNFKIVDHNWGSILSLRGVTGNTYNDTSLGSVDWSIPINSYGTKFSANYLEGDYIAGRELIALGQLGQSKIMGFQFSHPLIKRKNMGLSFTAGYSDKHAENVISNTISSIDDVRELYFSLDFDNLDRFLGKNILSLRYYDGHVYRVDNFPLSRTGNPSDQFDLFTLNMTRIQKLYGYTNLMLRGMAQYSDDRLPKIEQFSIGGYGTVRGHDPANNKLGDSGYSVTAELMFAPPFIGDKTIFGRRISQSAQFALFYDHGGVFTSNLNQLVVENRDEYLSGYGLGVRFFYKDRFSLKYDLGFPENRTENSPENFNYLTIQMNYF
jgi:hemolysin activation/secretion protein